MKIYGNDSVEKIMLYAHSWFYLTFYVMDRKLLQSHFYPTILMLSKYWKELSIVANLLVFTIVGRDNCSKMVANEQISLNAANENLWKPKCVYRSDSHASWNITFLPSKIQGTYTIPISIFNSLLLIMGYWFIVVN